MRLTDRIIQKLPAPAHGNKVTYDADVKGFGARITAAGGRAFVLTYRRKGDGRQRRFTIGSFPDWSTTAAREEAKRLKRDIDGGADPVGELVEGRAAATVADLAPGSCKTMFPASARRRSATTGSKLPSTSSPPLAA